MTKVTRKYYSVFFQVIVSPANERTVHAAVLLGPLVVLVVRAHVPAVVSAVGDRVSRAGGRGYIQPITHTHVATHNQSDKHMWMMWVEKQKLASRLLIVL